MKWRSYGWVQGIRAIVGGLRADDHDQQLVDDDGNVVRVVERNRYFDGDHGRSEEIGACVRHATVTAALPGCARLTAWIAPGSYFIGLGRQDELLGHPAFDDRYIVKTRDAALLRFWLGDDELDAILATYAPGALEPFTLDIERGGVTLVSASSFEAEPQHPAHLDDAIQAAAWLAGRPRRLATQWRERLAPLGDVTAGTSFSVDGDFALRIDGRAPVEVTFPDAVPVVRRRGLRTQLGASRDPAPAQPIGALWRPTLPAPDRPPRSKVRVARFTLAGLDGYDHPTPWLAAALAPVERALARAAPDAITIDATCVALRWERIVDDVERLRAGVAVVQALVAAPTGDGPYR